MSRFQIEPHVELASTNDRALELGRSAPGTWTAVVAERQTSGRGRRGNRWSSPAGGLYVSFLTWPDLTPAQAPMLSLLCGVALHEALPEGIRARVGLKWPNDLLVTSGPRAGRKLAGILVESSSAGGALGPVVFGIGLNRVPRSHDAVDHGRAVSIAELDPTDRTASVEWVERIGERLVAALDRATREGTDWLVKAFNLHCFGRGEEAMLITPRGSVSGLLEGIVSGGAIGLQTPEGLRTFMAGTLDFPTRERQEYH